MAQVVERYFREVEAASSSLVTPIGESAIIVIAGSFFPYRKLGFSLFHIVPFLKGETELLQDLAGRSGISLGIICYT